MDRLVRIPGVGKKTAERMVLELRDKLPAVSGEEPDGASAPPRFRPVDQDVLSALLNLGCAPPAGRSGGAQGQSRPAHAGRSFEPLFRRALELVR